MRAAFLLLAFVPSLAAADLVPAGAKVEKLADGFAFTEGPAVDADGNVYFTDQPNDRIMLWSVDGKLTEWMKPCGRSNGLCFDKDGLLWACADEKNELWTIDPKTKKTTVLVKDFGGKLLNGPNDLWVTPTGGAYFTDPYYKRPYWKRGPIEQSTQGVYFLPPKGKLVRVADDLKQPNGIVGTPDGKTLYVADIGAKKTYRYAIAADGSLKDKALFCEEGSDGMTIDEAGNVYLTGRGVLVFDKAGKKVTRIPVPEGWTANVCFGGKAMDTLFITASKGLYAIKLNAKGAARQ